MSRLIVIFCASLFLSVCYADIKNEILAPFLLKASKCAEERAYSRKEVLALFNNQYAKTHEGGCLRFCALRKFGVLNSEAQWNLHKVHEIAESLKRPIDRTAGLEVVHICKGIKVSVDKCIAAEQYLKCIKRTADVLGVQYE